MQCGTVISEKQTISDMSFNSHKRCTRETEISSVLLAQMKFAGKISRRQRHVKKECQKSAQRSAGALVQYKTAHGEILQLLEEIHYQGSLN